MKFIQPGLNDSLETIIDNCLKQGIQVSFEINPAVNINQVRCRFIHGSNLRQHIYVLGSPEFWTANLRYSLCKMIQQLSGEFDE